MINLGFLFFSSEIQCPYAILSTMSQTERLMGIIGRLCQRNGKLNTRWIEDSFGVTDRQARRDIEYIRNRIIDQCFGTSVDLVYDRAKNEYHLTGSQEELKRLFARSVISSAVAASAVDPLRAVLGKETREDSSFNRVRYISQAAELPDYTIFTGILNAIDNNIRARICYKNINQIDTERIIEPLELINYSAIWYVRAYDLKREELRTFSLSRISSVEALDERREFNDFETLRKSDMAGYGIFLDEKTEEYTIHFHGLVAMMVANQVWHKRQRGEWIDSNTYSLSLPASDPTELVAKTLSYGADAEPISPKGFVDSYNKQLKRLFDKNKLNSNT